MALTGDTLFVGDAGRPDLVGLEAARDLAGHMHDTLNNEYLTLPDGTLILPGHGAGSLCGKSIGSVRSTTLGFERNHNPALAAAHRDDYIDLRQPPARTARQPQAHQGDQPPRAASALGEIAPRPLTTQHAMQRVPAWGRAAGYALKNRIQDQHIPGAVHLAADDQLSNRVGHVLQPDVP